MSPGIRLATAQDAEQIQAIYAPNVRDTAISFELAVPTVHDMQQRIAQTSDRWPWLVCEHHGAIQGYAYASAHRARAAYQWSVDVSVYVHPRAHRAGVGRGMYMSLFQLLVLQGYHNAYAGITLPNPASVRLHESVGFQPVGVYRRVGYKLGAWHDVGWWQLTLQDGCHAPATPQAPGQLVSTTAWTTALGVGLSSLRL